MTDTMKNLLIGIFVLAACGLIIFILLFIHPSIGDEAQKIKIRFADVDKVNPGTRVTFAGRPVGEVISIQEITDPKAPRLPHDGLIYSYELVLGVDSHIKIYNTDKIFLRTSGLLGERSVEISPEPAKPGEEVYEVNNRLLYGKETGSVEETLQEFKTVAKKIETALDSINHALTEFSNRKLWDNLSNIAKNVNDITTALNKPDQWAELLSHFHTLSKRALTSWDRVDIAINNLEKTSSNFLEISHTLHHGDSTLGKLLVRDDLYLRTSALFSKAETLFDDINHFGLLFNLDKGWQRLRARRANLITRLSTPTQFQNFFSDEINQITTSLGRVSMVLDETEWMDPDCLMGNGDFKKVFAELMRRIEALELSIKLYNEQLDDVETRKTQVGMECCY